MGTLRSPISSAWSICGGSLLNLIEFYFLLKDSESVADACIAWSQKVKQERKLKVVLMTIHRWMVDQEGWQVKERSLRRLGDEIVRMVYTFDDRSGAERQTILAASWGESSSRVGHLMMKCCCDSMIALRRFRNGVPNCYLCGFKARQQRSLLAQKIDLCSEQQKTEVPQVSRLCPAGQASRRSRRHQETLPKCRWCEASETQSSALQSPKKAALVTADRAFLPLGEILSREVWLLPSLAELKRQASSQNGTEGTG